MDCIKLCHVPENPGQLFYHKKEDYLLASSPGDSCYYTIWFNREIPDAMVERKHNRIQPTLFPNPSSGDLTLRFDLVIAIQGRVDIFTLDGKLVHSLRKQNWHAGTNLVFLSARGLKPGQYLVKISGSDGFSRQCLAVLW